METPGHIVPAQKQGGHTGATKKVDADTRHEALRLFEAAKRRLLDVNNWHRLCGKASADFCLTDAEGNLLAADAAKEGNLIRIRLPAPKNESGSGYDWVRIEKFENDKEIIRDEEVFGFRVRPVPNPLEKQAESAHFYTDDATSTFLVVRKSSSVSAMERGRNETPHPGLGSVLNKLRNITVAIAAMIGLSKPQWQSLVNGIIKGPAS